MEKEEVKKTSFPQITSLSEDSGTPARRPSSRERRGARSDEWTGEIWSDQKNRFLSGGTLSTDERPEAHGTMWRYAL